MLGRGGGVLRVVEGSSVGVNQVLIKASAMCYLMEYSAEPRQCLAISVLYLF